jgi:hypothetical protein
MLIAPQPYSLRIAPQPSCRWLAAAVTSGDLARVYR